MPPAARPEVIIAGAGPIGLLLANLLGQQGRRVLLVERRERPPLHSMAIGITPPSLALLNQLGLDESFIREGIRIETVRVYENLRYAGAVHFSRMASPYRFILSIPQSRTRELLRENLNRWPSIQLVDHTEVQQAAPAEHGIAVTLQTGGGSTTRRVEADLAVACDGHRSILRSQAGIRFDRRNYGCTFVMADYDDHTDFGDEARLYFSARGSVESFPLSGGKRRWIIQQLPHETGPACLSTDLARRVEERTGVRLCGMKPYWHSTFQPSYALASTFHSGRLVLCGDAAHVMSPIGGQGMNTGFADAARLAEILPLLRARPASWNAEISRYEADRKAAFRKAAQRAARGMWLGTRTGAVGSAFRKVLLKQLLLRPPVSDYLATCFAMLPPSSRASRTRPQLQQEPLIDA